MYLEKECQHRQAVGVVNGAAHGAVLILVEDGVQLHGEGVIVYEILGALPVVLAPVKVELLEDVGAVQRPARHVGLLATAVRRVEHC